MRYKIMFTYTNIYWHELNLLETFLFIVLCEYTINVCFKHK